MVSHRHRPGNPGGAAVFQVEDPGEIEYPTTLARGRSGDEHSPMFGESLTHSAARAGSRAEEWQTSRSGRLAQRIVPGPRGRAIRPPSCRGEAAYDPQTAGHRR